MESKSEIKIRLADRDMTLLRILSEYGRMAADDVVSIYGTKQYHERRIRELCRSKYITKNDGILQLLKKGREAVIEADKEAVIRSVGNSSNITKERQCKQSKLAAILHTQGMQILQTQYDRESSQKWFMQSAIVKERCDQLDSHSRVLGIIYRKGKQTTEGYAVYNIGEGQGKWYLSEENSVLGVPLYGAKVDKMVVYAKGMTGQANYEKILFGQGEADNGYRKRGRQASNNTKLSPDWKMCSVLPDNERGYGMMQLITSENWKWHVTKTVIPAEELENPKFEMADYYWKGKHVVVMVHNCIIKKRDLQNYAFAMQLSNSAANNIIIICLERHLSYLERDLPSYQKLTIADEELERIKGEVSNESE